ncbi:MAG: NAD(P)H-hydrate epimerase, partial [Acetobacterales bacterium]
MTRHELLSVAEMYAADKAAEASGVPSDALMEAAGRGVAHAILRRFPRGQVAVLAGPGNNGGDGFVVARLLRQAGWPVRLALPGARDRLKGDAALNADRWDGAVEPLSPAVLDGASLVVDALFGAGLTRPLEGIAAKTIGAVAARGMPVVAVDVPSGVHGDTGAVLGTAAPAVLTVTFFRRKPGHMLLPGRDLCGTVEVVDIGFPHDILAGISPAAFANEPALWRDSLPWPKASGHKYSRGHAVVCGGFPMTGAARLAARAARRAGAGLLTIAAPPDGVAAFQSDWPGAIVAPVADAVAFAALLDDPRRNAVLVGPGGGTGGRTREAALAALARGKATVLDADALTTFADNPTPLFDALSPRCVLTPHEGEYGRLFGAEGDRLSRARAAAAQSGAVIVLKGSDTVIARPDG